MFWKKKKEKPVLTWYDVTLDQYQKLQNIDTSELEGQIEAATILLGVDTDDMTWAEFCKELNKLDFLSKPMPKTIVRKSYRLNGKKYNCFVNLQNLTVSRYMDFVNLSKTKDLVKILAVFLIPDGKEYGSYDLDEVYEDIKTMNVVEASGIFSFFPLEFRACIEVLKDYSVKKLKKSPELRKAVLAIMESYSMSEL